MSRDGLLKILEESRMATESMRQNISVLSEITMRAREGLEKTYRNLYKSVEMIEESQRLLELLNQLRQNSHSADVQIARTGELASNELILAERSTDSGNGRH